MIAPFSPQQTAALCIGAARRIAIDHVSETGSTNADLLAALDHLPSPTLLVAESQTAGRGRAGRSWHSAPGATLTFSLAWQLALEPQALVGLPLAVGVALAEVLQLFADGIALKWPNDVQKDGSKIAGILIETAVSRQPHPGHGNGVWAVIGIGINLGLSEDEIARLGRPVANLSASPVDRNLLMAHLLNALADALELFEVQGFAAFMARWNALDAYIGSEIVILDGERVVHQGRAAGVDGSGCLLIDTAAGRIAVVAGDVSLRPREGDAI